ncbi:L-serine ammonia-lyase [Paracrocinitomix mangrovi]|uniref:L-serine ammonia-lyase n=1 Tax=Paracrocinitomix mangrovi TaxID=2862509 RepID=UPI001C8EFA80|nr:L-serine ammonia-lyase [Paracrocinitomix mangrovi]UKN03876.1 L-serine ammonia-lyase [Paracrocinitomix mangrovi]
MEYISTFDMLKIGVGPSSSHTLGPWRAAEKFIHTLIQDQQIDSIKSLTIDLYGSLSLTGKGHATDLAIMLGLSGADPEYVPVEDISGIILKLKEHKKLKMGGINEIDFDPDKDIIFNADFLPFHANGMRFTAHFIDGSDRMEFYYSIGGGFIVQERHDEEAVEIQNAAEYPFPIATGENLKKYCAEQNKNISDIVFENEKVLRQPAEIHSELERIWNTMLECMYIGCHTEGTLPGGLNVRRRAYDSHKNLIGDVQYNTPQEWLDSIRKTEVKFRQILKWVSCYALAVNEVNASLGRVVTAPTNGSAGVIPAVLMYYLTIENHEAGMEEIKRFLLVAGEIGSIFKKGSTISAAMGGCQAEIGVSSAMAAGALTELLGGTPDQVLIAAEIAMEHHLGLTCDPIGGLVQVPCIERNSMGAIKAINAAELAIDSDPKNVKVTLDQVINTMWDTAKDMNAKYKETSQGGLAIKVALADC